MSFGRHGGGVSPLRRAVFIWCFVIGAALVLPDANGNRWTKAAVAGAVIGMLVVVPTLVWTRLRERRAARAQLADVA